ncbi:MAG: polysaccharide biosynthesis protein [Clostridia bacterium]|nr:polysaccharide biosynthesis protein [Clostridia bacterium]
MAKKGLVKGAIILSAAGIICRLLGVLFRIPLSNIVGNYGIGLYQLVFPLYSLLLIVSSAGIPVALSKMIARVRDNRQQTKQIFVNALVTLILIGAVITIAFLVLARPIAAWQGKPEIWPLYLAIAPAVWFVCVISAYRGYFQGLNNMVPTAVSQIIEQAVKVAVGLGLAFWLIRYSILWAVFGAILAVAVSELVAAGFLAVVYAVRKRQALAVINPNGPVRGIASLLSWSVIRRIFSISAPIMVMSLAFPLVQLFDSFYIVNALKSNGVANATELYGISTGAVHTLINLPSVVGIAIATVMLPMVARAFKQGDIPTMRKKAWLALGFTLLFSTIVAIGLSVLPKFILTLLYRRAFANRPEELATAVLLLRIESWAVILIGLTQVSGSILQGVDHERVPMWAMVGGGMVKILFEIFALRHLDIMAVSIANILCFGVALAVNGTVLIKLFVQRK